MVEAAPPPAHAAKGTGLDGRNPPRVAGAATAVTGAVIAVTGAVIAVLGP
jgi:hypothetical protein